MPIRPTKQSEQSPRKLERRTKNEELTTAQTSPTKQVQGGKEKTWAEVVSEARHIFASEEAEGEIAPTQTGEGEERKTSAEIEEGGIDDEGYTVVLGRKRKISRERSGSRSPQGSKSQRTYPSSEESDSHSSGGDSVVGRNETDINTRDDERQDQQTLSFDDMLFLSNC